MRIRYRPQALGDIDEIGRYVEKRNPAGAANVLRAIYAAIHLVAEQPYAYRSTDEPEIRVAALRRYRYKIYYSVLDESTVEIIHVRHASRRSWEAGR
jgi:plasmid stabilization system protein ParE